MTRVPFDEPGISLPFNAEPPRLPAPPPEVVAFLKEYAETGDATFVRPAQRVGAVIAHVLCEGVAQPFTSFQLAAKVYPEEVMQASKLGEKLARIKVLKLASKVAKSAVRLETVRCLAGEGLYLQRGAARRIQEGYRPSRQISVYRAIPKTSMACKLGRSPKPCKIGQYAVNWQAPILPPARYR